MAEKGYEATKDTTMAFSSYKEEYDYCFYFGINGNSEYHLGAMTFLGRGIDITDPIRWIESFMEYFGRCRRIAYKRTVSSYTYAIGDEDCPPEAKLELGYMYTHGVIVETDLEEAKTLLENVIATTPASSDYAKEAQKILSGPVFNQ